ncbi:MAG: filamentous hemagglutinin N-terminal domain-containing protein, partial [Pseudomonadota bacterium]
MIRTAHTAKMSLLGAVSSAAILAMTGAQAQVGSPDTGTIIGAATATAGAGTSINDPNWLIEQTDDRVVIEWDSLSIADGEFVRFDQASSTNIAVNRVIGPGGGAAFDATLINGTLQANGQVWIINPNGVTFGSTARVDVNGLLATTADFADINGDAIDYLVDNNAFVFGSATTLVFDVEGVDGASVNTLALADIELEEGESAPGIRVGSGGLKLVGEAVSHRGEITLTDPVGLIELATSAGDGDEVFSLVGDLSNGMGLVQIPITADQTTIELAGTIMASGGAVRITAAGLEAAIADVASGTVIEADTITLQSDGTISLTSELTELDGAVTARAVTREDDNGDIVDVVTSDNTVDIELVGDLSVEEALGFDIALTGASVSLGAITAERSGGAGGDLTVTAENDDEDPSVIDDALAGTLLVEGETILVADGGITLDDAGHDFVGDVTVTDGSGAISLRDANDLTIAALTMETDQDLTLRAGSSLDGNGVEGELTLPGVTADDVTLIAETITGSTITAGGDLNFTSDDAINGDDFAFTVAGESVFTSNVGSIALLDTDDDFGTLLTADAPSEDGAITIDLLGDQTVIARAGTPGSVTATNTVSVITAGVLTMEEAFGFDVDLTGSSVVLGEITTEQFSPGGGADPIGGELTVMADATITDDDDAGINGAGDLFIAGASTLTAPGGITLDEVSHDFVGAVTATAAGTAGSVTLVDANDLTATVQAGMAGSIETFNTVSVTAEGALSIVEALGFDIDLTGGSVSLGMITAEEIDPGEGDPFGGDLTVTAENGSIDDNIDGIFTIDGDAEFTADTDGESIIIDDPGHLFGGKVTATGHDLMFDFEASTPIIGTLIATGLLTLEAEGTLTGDPTDFLDIDETAALTSNEGSILFESASNSFGGDVTALADGTITLSGGSTNLTIDATAGDEEARGDVDLDTTGVLTVTSFGAATVLDAQSIVVTSIDATSVVATTEGNISGGSTVVSGTTQLTSTSGTIDLTGENNFQGLVTAIADGAAGAITLDDTADLNVIAIAGTEGALTATNSVEATATGTLTADIFAHAIITNGASVVLAGIDALADVDGDGGTLMVDALTGTITDTGQVTVEGETNLQAMGDITLDNATNDFNALVTAVSDEGAIEIVDIDALTVDLTADDAVVAEAGGALVTVAASGASVDLMGTSVQLFDIDSNGMLMTEATSGGITDGDGAVAGSAINVAGETHLTAIGAIDLTNTNNDFVGSVNASGTAIRLFDAQDLLLADIDAGGDLAITAVSGSITDGSAMLAGEDIDVTGDAVFVVDNAVDGSVITINDDTNSFGGTVTADGFDILLGFSGGQELGTINAAGDIDVEAGGDLLGGTIFVMGTSDLTSAGSITLTDASNDFQGTVNAQFDDPEVPNTDQTIDIFDSTDLDLVVGSADVVVDEGGNLVVGTNQFVNAASGGDLTFIAFGPAVVLESEGAINIVQAVASTFEATAVNDITGQLVVATDAALLTSQTGSIALSNNAFFAAVTARAEEGDVSIQQASDLEIDATGIDIDLESSGDLTVIAAGANVNLTGENVIIDAVTATESLAVQADDNITGLVEAATLLTTASGGNVEVIN